MEKIRQIIILLLVIVFIAGCTDDGQEDIIEDGKVTKESLLGTWNYTGYRVEYYINGELENVSEGKEGDNFSITFSSNNRYHVGGNDLSEGTYVFENEKLIITYTVEEDHNGDGELETYTYNDELDAYFEDGKLVFKYENDVAPPGSSDEHKEIGFEYFERAL